MKAKLFVPVLMMTVLLSYASIASAAPSKTDYVKYKTSTRRNQPPVSNFNYSTDELTASFTDASYDPDGLVVSWSWSFGDGATSWERNPTHTYSTPGTYEVTLIVTDNAGATDSVSKNVTVTLLAPKPTPSYTPPPSPTNPDFTVSILPPSQSVTQGESTSYTVTVASLDWYEGMISLSLSGLPRNSTGSLAPSSVHLSSGGTANSKLSVTTTGSTPTGTHTLTVTGTGSRTRSATASLTVQEPATPTLPQVYAVSAGPGPPSLKAYDRGSRYDPLVISYYDMTAAGWDASKAAENVWARAGEYSPGPQPDITPPPTSTTSTSNLSLSPEPAAPPITNILSVAVSTAKAIIGTLLPFKLF